MKNLKFLIVIAIPFIASSGFSFLLPGEVKDTFSIFQHNFRDLSPLPGIVWAQGGVAENFGELGYGKNKSVESINSLLRRIDPESFLPSTAAEKLSAHLNSYSIGKLAYHLHRLTFHNDADVKDISLGSGAKKAVAAKTKFVDFLIKMLIAEPSVEASRKRLKEEYLRRKPELERLIKDKAQLESELKVAEDTAQVRIRLAIVEIDKKIHKN